MLTSSQTLGASSQTPPSNFRSQPTLNTQPPPAMGMSGAPPQMGPPPGPTLGQPMGPPPAFGALGPNSPNGSPLQERNSPMSGAAPPQLPTPHSSTPLYSQTTTSIHSTLHNDTPMTELPAPSRPVFGISLDDLLRRDGSAIPLVVYQCLQAVDLYGLDVEGIYRLSGSAAHVAKLRAMFDNGE